MVLSAICRPSFMGFPLRMIDHFAKLEHRGIFCSPSNCHGCRSFRMPLLPLRCADPLVPANAFITTPGIAIDLRSDILNPHLVRIFIFHCKMIIYISVFLSGSHLAATYAHTSHRVGLQDPVHDVDVVNVIARL